MNFLRTRLNVKLKLFKECKKVEVDQIFAKYELNKQECPSPSLSFGFEKLCFGFVPHHWRNDS